MHDATTIEDFKGYSAFVLRYRNILKILVLQHGSMEIDGCGQFEFVRFSSNFKNRNKDFALISNGHLFVLKVYVLNSIEYFAKYRKIVF